MSNTTILHGYELSNAQIDFMIDRRMTEYGENTKDFKKNERVSIFFFLNEGESVKAFGMLKPVGITHKDKHYRVLGIGNIIAVEKGKGYGKALVQAMKNYLTNTHTSGLGFCDDEICTFYVKCGYQIINGLSDRFRYKNTHQDGQKEKLDGERGVIYLEGSDKIATHLLEDHELIYIDVPFW